MTTFDLVVNEYKIDLIHNENIEMFITWSDNLQLFFNSLLQINCQTGILTTYNFHTAESEKKILDIFPNSNILKGFAHNYNVIDNHVLVFGVASNYFKHYDLDNKKVHIITTKDLLIDQDNYFLFNSGSMNTSNELLLCCSNTTNNSYDIVKYNHISPLNSTLLTSIPNVNADTNFLNKHLHDIFYTKNKIFVLPFENTTFDDEKGNTIENYKGLLKFTINSKYCKLKGDNIKRIIQESNELQYCRFGEISDTDVIKIVDGARDRVHGSSLFEFDVTHQNYIETPIKELVNGGHCLGDDIEPDMVFLTSHNLLYYPEVNRLFMIDNAKIIKFNHRTKEIVGIVSDPLFFRGTSVILTDKYLFSMGFPNRVFRFNRFSLELEHYFDIGDAILGVQYTHRTDNVNDKRHGTSLFVNNLQMTEQYVYIFDTSKMLIYTHTGELIESIDFNEKICNYIGDNLLNTSHTFKRSLK